MAVNKINIHAHSVFSDGANTPYVMALKAKELGFSALVLTDHFYNGKYPENGMCIEKEHSYKRAIREAKTVLPVIRGIEVPYCMEEVLVFGKSAIEQIISDGGLLDIAQLRKDHNCAIILCHPNVHWPDFVEHLDGYERHNNGQDYFKNDRELGKLANLQAWHNSDAHRAEGLMRGYNLTSVEITTEQQLIKYIKSQVRNGYLVERGGTQYRHVPDRTVE